MLETLEDVARCDLFLFVYDQNDANSFSHVLELYQQHIHAQQLLSEDGTRQISLSHVPALLVQCKSDIPKVSQVCCLIWTTPINGNLLFIDVKDESRGIHAFR
mgnify:FL=1